MPATKAIVPPTCNPPQPEQALAQFPHLVRLQLQPDQEKQQHHAEFGEMQNLLGIGDQFERIWPDQDARQQISQHGAEAKTFEQGHRKHGGGEVNRGFHEETGRVHGRSNL